MNEILFTGVKVEELLSQIGQLFESKIKALHAIPTDNKQSDYFSRKELSAHLKISLPTLHEWTKLKLLKSYKIGSRVLYKKVEVEESLTKVLSLKHKKVGYHGSQR